MTTQLSRPRWYWALALMASGGGWHDAAAQAGRPGTGQPRLEAPSTFAEPMLPGTGVAQPPSPPRQGLLAKRIFFPPDPPPLGAQINIDPRRVPNTEAPPELASHVTEAFYAPLSSCLTDVAPHSQRKLRMRLDAYTKTRDRLRDELRAVLAVQAGEPSDVRAREFTSLAHRQGKALEALEAEAESLRAAMAEKAGWSDLRQWKLGAGPLHRRLPEHQVLEFQVVRAAAFYQPGLSPAQRRLLREAAMQMQDEMFADASMTSATPPGPEVPPRLVFFSPDLVRLLPLAEMPPAVVERLDAFVAEKDALRDELVATVIAEDRAKFSSNRRRALGDLARARAARIAALETRAEEIRLEYLPVFERHRLPRPYSLPAGVVAMIDTFMARRVALQSQLYSRLDAARGRVIAHYQGNNPRELRDLQMQEIQSVIDAFGLEHAEEMEVLNAELERIHGALVASVGEAALRAEGRAPDAFLNEYVARYRQSWAYYEYEIAVFEPALAPAQRRLLLGGAIRWLDLPLPRPERQPVALPLTILSEEQKLPGARVR